MKSQVVKKFQYALKGIGIAIREEAHMKFHLMASITVICLSFYFELSGSDWSMVLLATGLVIGAELTNSAIENMVDLMQPEYHPIAGKIKDIAAGTVLLCSLIAAAIGCIIFWPHICSFLSQT